ncbi:hypothetical protein [Deinococcus ruber]|uniref:hypothetical protein n=1 Tax=Deinococcus ruber TaxID=1848197 RepID=UPI00166AE7BE|nr:hypothetical protein [Deinococcus ruber]
MMIEAAFNAADDRRRLSASREALSQFNMPDVSRLQNSNDDQKEQRHLALTVVREVGVEGMRQLIQDSGRRVLLSRGRHEFSSPLKTVGC